MEPKFKIYDKVTVFGRVVTIIDYSLYNNSFNYTGESAQGYEAFSEEFLIKELNIKDMPKLDYEIGQEVIIVDAKDLRDNTDRELERAIVTDIDTNGIDLVYRVTFKDGNSAHCLPSRLMSVDSFESENYTVSPEDIENKTDGLLDNVVADLINKLEDLKEIDVDLKNVFKECVDNKKVVQTYLDFDEVEKNITIEIDKYDFYRIDLNPQNTIEDKIVLSHRSFTNLFAAMRKM